MIIRSLLLMLFLISAIMATDWKFYGVNEIDSFYLFYDKNTIQICGPDTVKIWSETLPIECCKNINDSTMRNLISEQYIKDLEDTNPYFDYSIYPHEWFFLSAYLEIIANYHKCSPTNSWFMEITRDRKFHYLIFLQYSIYQHNEKENYKWDYIIPGTVIEGLWKMLFK